jgi:hypothetical protein
MLNEIIEILEKLPDEELYYILKYVQALYEES